MQRRHARGAQHRPRGSPPIGCRPAIIPWLPVAIVVVAATRLAVAAAAATATADGGTATAALPPAIRYHHQHGCGTTTAVTTTTTVADGREGSGRKQVRQRDAKGCYQLYRKRLRRRKQRGSGVQGSATATTATPACHGGRNTAKRGEGGRRA